MCRAFFFTPPKIKGAACLESYVQLLSGKGRLHTKGGIKMISRQSRVTTYCQKVPRGSLNPHASILSGYPGRRKVRVLLHSVSPRVVTISRLKLPRSFTTITSYTQYKMSVLKAVRTNDILRILRHLRVNKLSLVHSRVQLVNLREGPSKHQVLAMCRKKKGPL